MMPKSRRKEKFLFLKQILEESDCDKENDGTKDAAVVFTKSDKSVEEKLEKQRKGSSDPVGKYPVLFKKTCKNKGCQTRLSAFPLFPLPEETEWISDDEAETKKKSTALKKKRKQNKSVKDSKKQTVDQDYTEAAKMNNKVKNSDGTRKDFRSEHQLKETDNPVLQAWLHKKSIVARKQRKLERKERRAKKAALEEETRIKNEREIESDERVREWLKRKRKEARIFWRGNRTRVEPKKVDTTLGGDSSPQPPPEYRVVTSFQCTEPSPVADNLLENDAYKNNSVDFATPVAKGAINSCSKALDKLDTQKTEDKTDQSNINGNQAKGVKKVKCRPKTAVDHSETASSVRHKTERKRPKTAREKSLKNTTPAVQSSDSSKKMQSLNYDQWLRVKRDADKEKVIQKKRELIDSHLEAVIKELGKKRVEKIMSPRKQVDTGLKNVSRLTEPVQPVVSKMKKGSPYRWLLSKKPRPEPQGCDYPEAQGTDRTVVSCSQHTDKDNDANDGDLVTESNHDHITAGTRKQPKVHIQEIDEKYNELKPSIEKVKDILDAEIKKLKESGKSSKKELDKSSQQTTELSEQRLKARPISARPSSARPSSARPSSARPTTAQPIFIAKPGSAYLTEEQAKKIASDLDILGLCGSDAENGSNSETEDVKDDKKSTVRENYFDYGSEVDLPTPGTLEFVQ